MFKAVFKVLPITSIAIALIVALIFPIMVTGENVVINDAIVQAKWCISGDALCLLKVYGWISFWLLFAGFCIDFTIKFFNKIRNRKEAAKKSTVKDDSPKQEPVQSLSTPKVKRVRKSSYSIQRSFSANLEKMKKDAMNKGWKPTGLGLGFLDRIKTAPPFLGKSYEKPIISPSDEQTLTEFFIASMYMEKYRDVIKGGSYTIRTGDDPKSIAKNKYGDEKHHVHIPGLHTYPGGMILELPYINLERPDSDEFIRSKLEVSKDIEKLRSLLESYHLVRDETIPLLRMVYDAAQRTLDEENNKENIPLVNKTTTKPKREDLAYQIGIEIQEFRKIFDAKRTGTPDEIRSHCTFASQILKQIIDTELPQASLVFKERKQFEEKITSLDNLYGEYCMLLLMLADEDKGGVYTELQIKMRLLGAPGDDSLISKIYLEIDELIQLLNQEGK